MPEVRVILVWHTITIYTGDSMPDFIHEMWSIVDRLLSHGPRACNPVSAAQLSCFFLDKVEQI